MFGIDAAFARSCDGAVPDADPRSRRSGRAVGMGGAVEVRPVLRVCHVRVTGSSTVPQAGRFAARLTGLRIGRASRVNSRCMTERLRTALAEVSSAASAFSSRPPTTINCCRRSRRSAARSLHGTVRVAVDEGRKTITPVAVHDNDPEVMTKYRELLMRTRSAERPIIAQLSVSHVLYLAGGSISTRYVPISTRTASTCSEARRDRVIAILLRVRAECRYAHRAAASCRLPALDDVDGEIAVHLARLQGSRSAMRGCFATPPRSRCCAGRGARRAGHEFLDAIIENIPDMVFVKDADRLTFVRFNRAGENLLGFARRADRKKRLRFFRRKRPSSSSRRIARRCAARDGRYSEEPIKTTRGERWLHTKECRLVDATGEARFLAARSVAIGLVSRCRCEMRAVACLAGRTRRSAPSSCGASARRAWSDRSREYRPSSCAQRLAIPSR